MRVVTVFLGSSVGDSPAYARAAEDFGRLLAARDLDLVYGGGGIGLMKRLADAALKGGSRVTGVLPEFFLAHGAAHRGLTELRVVGSMHERKRTMAELGDAFVALPGGIGTTEEILEAVTWAQLGLHAKPCGLLNVEGYYDPLMDWLTHMNGRGFFHAEHLAHVLVDADAGRLLDRLAAAPAPRDVFTVKPPRLAA